ncbi:MAG: GreA/GreB family elongation factor [Deltaproteobacteria bacterium]|nr:GreA/GreB family elongation factor [Deltaproteobacteria bacterium]
MEKILLTRAGYEKLLKELELLSRVERPRVLHEILQDAPDWGFEAGPDFKSTLARREWVDQRIKQLQDLLANAEVLVGSNLPPDQVRFNARVRILNLHTGKEQHFKLVGPFEADAGNGRLSTASPLGQALMGRTLGERVEVETPAGKRSYQILEIEMDAI